jgi:tRNA-2-methylthio-N6-dimethylallyladenosine synthase
MRAVRFQSIFSFKYSPRPNTLALKKLQDDVPEQEKTRRIVALQALQREIQIELHEAAVGRVEEVLVDAVSRRRSWELSGRTSGNVVVNFPGDAALMGQMVPIRLERAAPNSLWGRIATST